MPRESAAFLRKKPDENPAFGYLKPKKRTKSGKSTKFIEITQRIG
jgi:hypothetical protein